MDNSVERVYQDVSSIRRIQEQLRTVETGFFSTISQFLALPGLVGFWPMSSVQRSTGNAYDMSGQSRTLTYNGNPTYNIFNNFIPYFDADGTGDFLSRADETDLDILGSETIYASAVRGLTLGGWFYFDRLATDEGLISKAPSAGNYAYALQKLSAGNVVRLIVSGDGTNLISISSAAVATATWYFIVGRYIPSTSVDIYVSGVKSTNTTSIPAALFNSTASLLVGSLGTASQPLDGRATLCFLCANALPDTIIASLFNETRGYFRV